MTREGVYETTLEVRKLVRSPPITFRKDELVVGWGPDADLEILTAEERHAVISIDEHGIAWVTNVSPRGTWVDGEMIDERTRLDIDSELAVAHDRREVGETIIMLASAPVRSPAVHSRWQVDIVQMELMPPVQYAFAKPRIVVGRDSSADIPLWSEDVATPAHCEIVVDGAGQLHVTDLGSELGTRVGDKQVEGPTPLSTKDELFVAEYAIRVIGVRFVETPKWEVTVHVQQRGDGAPTVYKLRKNRIGIGRTTHEDNDIVLPKGNVSKRHARLAVKDGKVIAFDMKSTNGTYINGRLLSAPLVMKPGDKLYVGDFVITLPHEPVPIESSGE